MKRLPRRLPEHIFSLNRVAAPPACGRIYHRAGLQAVFAVFSLSPPGRRAGRRGKGKTAKCGRAGTFSGQSCAPLGEAQRGRFVCYLASWGKRDKTLPIEVIGQAVSFSDTIDGPFDTPGRITRSISPQIMV